MDNYEYIYNHPPQFTDHEAINWREVALALTDALDAVLKCPADGLTLTVNQPVIAAANEALNKAWTLAELWGTK